MRAISAPAVAALFMLLACSTPEDRTRDIEKSRPPSSYQVVINQMKFVPAELTLNAGDTVTWTNQDIVDHNVAQDPGKKWSSSPLKKGQSWKMVVTESEDYLCTIHPVMKGKLVVR